MSQKLVYDLIKEMGGQVTIYHLKTLIRERYPSYTLDQYLSNRIRSLVTKGCIEYDKILRMCTIVDTFD